VEWFPILDNIYPYPNGEQAKENPHVLASIDMVNWVEPLGYSNPLEPEPDGAGESKYNSDTHIIYNGDVDRLEVFWRFVDDTVDEVTIYRKTTTDGVNWTSKEVVLQAARSVQDYVSPAIIYENNTYKMWYVHDSYKLWYIESSDGLTWNSPVEKVIPYETPMNNWHIDIIHEDGLYELFVTAFEDGQNRNTMTLYRTVSQDNINYSIPEVFLTPSKQEFTWDNMGVYRAGVTVHNGKYYIVYSAISKRWERGTGITTSYIEEPEHTKGAENYPNPIQDYTQISLRRTTVIGMENPNEDYRVYFTDNYLDRRTEMISSDNSFKPDVNGFYMITSYYTFDKSVDGNVYLRLYENGEYVKALGGSSEQQICSFSRLVYLKAGKTYDFYVRHTSSTSKSITDFNMEICKVV